MTGPNRKTKQFKNYFRYMAVPGPPSAKSWALSTYYVMQNLNLNQEQVQQQDKENRKDSKQYIEK